MCSLYTVYGFRREARAEKLALRFTRDGSRLTARATADHHTCTMTMQHRCCPNQEIQTVCGHTLSLSLSHTQLRVRPRGSHQPTSACGPIVPPSIRYGPGVLVPPSREQVSGGAGHDADSRAPPTHASAHVSVQAHGRLQRGSVGGVHPLMHLLPPSPRAPQQHIPCPLPLCIHAPAPAPIRLASLPFS